MRVISSQCPRPGAMHSVPVLRRAGPLGCQSLQTTGPVSDPDGFRFTLSPPSSGSERGPVSDGKGAMPLTGARGPATAYSPRELRAGPAWRQERAGQGREPGQAAGGHRRLRYAFKSGAGLRTEQAHQPAATSTMFLLIRKACVPRLWGTGAGACGEICPGSALSAQLSEKEEALRVVLTEADVTPGWPFPGRRATCWVLGTNWGCWYVHRCAASSLSGPWPQAGLVRKLASGNTSKLNLK